MQLGSMRCPRRCVTAPPARRCRRCRSRSRRIGQHRAAARLWAGLTVDCYTGPRVVHGGGAAHRYPRAVARCASEGARSGRGSPYGLRGRPAPPVPFRQSTTSHRGQFFVSPGGQFRMSFAGRRSIHPAPTAATDTRGSRSASPQCQDQFLQSLTHTTDPRAVGDPGMCARSLCGNREISWPTTGRSRLVRIGKAWSRSR